MQREMDESDIIFFVICFLVVVLIALIIKLVYKAYFGTKINNDDELNDAELNNGSKLNKIQGGNGVETSQENAQKIAREIANEYMRAIQPYINITGDAEIKKYIIATNNLSANYPKDIKKINLPEILAEIAAKYDVQNVDELIAITGVRFIHFCPDSTKMLLFNVCKMGACKVAENAFGGEIKALFDGYVAAVQAANKDMATANDELKAKSLKKLNKIAQTYIALTAAGYKTKNMNSFVKNMANNIALDVVAIRPLIKCVVFNLFYKTPQNGINMAYSLASSLPSASSPLTSQSATASSQVTELLKSLDLIQLRAQNRTLVDDFIFRVMRDVNHISKFSSSYDDFNSKLLPYVDAINTSVKSSLQSNIYNNLQNSIQNNLHNNLQNSLQKEIIKTELERNLNNALYEKPKYDYTLLTELKKKRQTEEQIKKDEELAKILQDEENKKMLDDVSAREQRDREQHESEQQEREQQEREQQEREQQEREQIENDKKAAEDMQARYDAEAINS